MKFRVLALDYDGTIAFNGVLEPEVRSAIQEARARGIIVILVTGRILADLQKFVSDLTFVDAVVAENGGVMAFAGGQTRTIGFPPPAVFLSELARQGVPYECGECVVETDANRAEQILGIIRRLELPLVLHFNHGRVMVLPQAISKSSGLRAILRILRLSEHNCIAIGDAENDHELLRVCELGVAVAWGSAALARTADEILPGSGPAAVARYIRGAMNQSRLPPQRLGRRHLKLGQAQDGHTLSLAIKGRSLLITGDPHSGKSWIAGSICEQLILQGYCVWVIDPEGEYSSLEALPGVVVLGGGRHPPRLSDLVRALRYPDVSVVVDIAHLTVTDKLAFLRSLLPMLASLRQSTGLPHRIVLDEAHYFLHEQDVSKFLDLQLGAYVLVTYHPAELNPEICKSIEGVITTRLTEVHEQKSLLRLCRTQHGTASGLAMANNLKLGEAVLFPGIEEAHGCMQRFTVLPRLTPHIRHRLKYRDVPVAWDKGFVFTVDGKPMGPIARTVNEFVAQITTVPSNVLEAHVRRSDFSRWIQDVVRDEILSSEIRTIEHQSQLGQVSDLRNTLLGPIQERYPAPTLSV